MASAVSLKLSPYGSLGAAAAGMLSVDGRCKTLDARANGYARSEGVGAMAEVDDIVERTLRLLREHLDAEAASRAVGRPAFVP